MNSAEVWENRVLAGGRYRVLRKLGEGGMGVVYQAHDGRLDTDVVVKVPHPFMLRDAGFAERFRREIRSLVKLSHPHIVKIMDVGEHDGLPFAVMQYLDGGSLDDRRPVDAQGNPRAIRPEGLKGWLEELAKALDFIHKRGYVHRDVKPANILFDADKNVYLSDFGIVKALEGEAGGKGTSSLTGTGMVLGTPEYMAPEVIMGQGCDGRADQYALAVVVHELLSGRPPFEGPTPAAVLVMQSTTVPPNLRQAVRSVSADIASTVARGLSKDPNKRYGDCASFADSVVAARPVAAGPPEQAGVASPKSPPSPLSPTPTGERETAGQQSSGAKTPPFRSPAAEESVPVAAQAVENDAWPQLDKRWLVGMMAGGLVLLLVGLTWWAANGREEPVASDGDLSVAESGADPFAAPARPTGRAADTEKPRTEKDLEKQISNSLGMKLVLIPAGEFWMGSSKSPALLAKEFDTKAGYFEDEYPQHRVRITQAFYLGATEVTQGQWEQVMGTRPWSGKDYVKQGGEYAATYMSWEDAVEFCGKLSAKEGGTYRLPTEAEWEYACRASSTAAYSFGDDKSKLGMYAWHDENTYDIDEKYAHGVGQKRANGWGLYDMHGNVWEWCSDWYNGDYYEGSPTDDPTGPSSGSRRVYRGGSWHYNARYCRSANRAGDAPDDRDYTRSASA